MRTTPLLALALALLAGTCSPPAPFDPGADCPKEAYCGQCASRGGCSWCGDPADSSKGQCVAIGHSECVAPSAWSKTPDRCPLPPADAGAPAPVTTAAPAPAPAGQERREAVRRALTRAFPDAHVTPQVIDAVVAVLSQPHFPLAPPPGVKSPTGGEAAPLVRPVREKEHRLYLGHATHHRVKGLPPAAQPLQSEFTMALPMVRVSLPDQLEAGHLTVATEIGDVNLSVDHLLGSIDLIAGKYSGPDYLGYRPERVDLITPARSANTRFGAIAVYLGYRKKADRGPSFYLLEAGTATGDAKMIYFSPDMRPIQSVTSYYLPTPFVSMRNTYSGGITMQPAPSEDEPAELVVQSHAEGAKDPYITVTVRYKRAPTMDLPIPAELTVDAGARVSLIAQTLGLPDAEQLEGVLGALAKTFRWQEEPHYVAP